MRLEFQILRPKESVGESYIFEPVKFQRQQCAFFVALADRDLEAIFVPSSIFPDIWTGRWGPMIGENRQLVTDEAVEFEK